jgi:hypothetical protein
MADKRISQLIERTDIANNDVLPIVASGATTTNKVTISTIQDWMQDNLDVGVTSVGITFGTSGTDINASGSPVTSSGNITINLPTASATNRGALSSADWITFNSKQPAGNYVTLDTAQTITAQKTFTTSGSSDTMIISHGSGSGFALDVIKAGNNEAIRVTKTSGSGNAMSITGGNFSAEAATFSGTLSTTPDAVINGVNVGKGGGSISSNTRLGVNSIQVNTTGTANTGIGNFTLQNNTTGSGNTAIGSASMQLNTTGGSNTAIGLVALTNNTTGNANTATGAYALENNTTGSNNTAVGQEALENNIVGAFNTAIGFQALQDNTNSSNTAIGYLASSQNSSGSANFSGGARALENNTTGSVNTSIGFASLQTNTTGGGNVAIGEDAGRFTSVTSVGNTNGGDSVFIGRQTKPLGDSQTNQIVIGHNAIGNGSNTVTIGNSSITNNYFTGNIRGASLITTADSTINQVTIGKGAGGSVDFAYNTAIGSGTLVSNTTGVFNTAVGFNALANHTTGNNQVALGLSAGRYINSGANNVLSSSSVYIGVDSRASASGNSNEIVIGHEARGNGSNTVTLGNDSITNTYLKGAVTLTGALNGTSAAFSSTLEGTIINSTSNAFRFSGNNALSLVTLSGQNVVKINAAGYWGAQLVGANDQGLLINNTGAATFSSNIVSINGNGLTEFKINNNTSEWELYMPSGSTDLRFYRGADKVTFLANGNVGIGTASPAKKLDVYEGSTSTVAQYIRNTTVNGLLQIDGTSAFQVGTETNHPLILLTNNTERMRITSGGNVLLQSDRTIGLNTSDGSDTGYLGIAGGGADGSNRGGTIYLSGNERVTDAGNVKIIAGDATSGTGQPGTIVFRTSSSDRMVITSGGSVGIGKTGSITGLDIYYASTDVVNSRTGDGANSSRSLFTGWYSASPTTSGTLSFNVTSNGNVTNTNNSYGSISDAKLKENITDASPKLEDLLKVKVRNYNLIGSEIKQIGVIAQELEEVFPAMVDESEDFEEVEVHQLDEEGNEVLNEEGEVVTTKERISKGTTTKSVKYSVFVPILIKAIQEQQEQINSLKNQIK